MKDPERLSAGGDLGGALLRAGKDYDAAQARERKAAALGAAATGAAIAGAALGSGKLLPSLGVPALLDKWALIGVVGVASAGVVVATRASREPGPVAHSPAALPSARAKAGPVAPVAPASSAAAVEIDLDEPLEAPAPVAAPSRKAAKVEPKAEPVPALAEPAPSLAEEVTSLQAARAALAAGEAEKAIALLDGHQRRFPQGALRVEAEMVRIEALARAGDARGAASRARRFAEEHPDTPYSRRARAMVGDAGAGE